MSVAFIGNLYNTGLQMIGTAGIYGFGGGLVAHKVFSLNIKNAAALFFTMELLALSIDKLLRACISFKNPYPTARHWSFQSLQFLKEHLILAIAYLATTRLLGVCSGGGLLEDFVAFTAIHTLLYTGGLFFPQSLISV